MTFSDFVKRLFSAVSAGSNTKAFTKSVIEAVLTDEGQDILDEYSESSFKNYYNGSQSPTRLSKKVNAYIEPMGFLTYIDQFSDAAVENICTLFSGELPDITPDNAGEMLGNLLASILTEAAGSIKKSSPKGAEKPMVVITDHADIAPDLVTYQDGIFYMGAVTGEHEEESDPFEQYLEKAKDYYSIKKTLLYAEKPRQFYDIYVCNDLKYHQNGNRHYDNGDANRNVIISGADVKRLEQESKYIIIEGTGGIGKSMLLTHLFLSSAEEYFETDRLPVLIPLKDYRETTASIVEFIWTAVHAFDSSVTQGQVIDALASRSLILLFDGLDEIQSNIRGNFDTDLDAFIKSYPGNSIFITSRPVHNFVSFAKFSLFDIRPLTRKQALALLDKLEFWDETAKKDFILALDKKLYETHYQFASNPLLLTIMLMTYSMFGEVPEKMHVFYAKAYETMARLHDATKGSYKRPFHTKLTPEEFARYFSEFCARTYVDEKLEFDDRTFATYMQKVLKNTQAEQEGIQPRDFLLDLTDNLCIMYHEGDKYYFIHRSFQEYFTAVYYASGYDEKLTKVGRFFEKMPHRSYSDKTFGMLYDMIPEKVERYIFLPFLEEMFTECSVAGTAEEYWTFLESQYPEFIYEEGEVGESYLCEAQSFIYRNIIQEKGLASKTDIYKLKWPEQIRGLPSKNWVCVYRKFTDYAAYEQYPDPEKIDETELDETVIVDENSYPYMYTEYFGEPDVVGTSISVETAVIHEHSSQYADIHAFMEKPDFPFAEEFKNVKRYYADLKKRTERETESDDLFDD